MIRTGVMILTAWLMTNPSSASVIKIDGPVHPLPPSVSIEKINVTLSKNQLQKLTQETLALRIAYAGFKPINTTLKQCRDDFNYKSVQLRHLPYPLFVIGDDSVSLAWLKHYKKNLEQHHAIGLIISANSLDSLKQIRQVAGSLSLYLAKGDALSARLNVPCYPVLISKHIIEH